MRKEEERSIDLADARCHTGPVFTTNTTIRIVFANSIRDYFNRPDLLDYSNSRVFAE